MGGGNEARIGGDKGIPIQIQETYAGSSSVRCRVSEC